MGSSVRTTPRRLFLDLDGVFFDFDNHVKAHFGKLPNEMEEAVMWSELRHVDGFYRTMPLMPYARDLYACFVRFKPTFLSGLPIPDGRLGYVAHDKHAAVHQHFPGTPLIVCASRDKSDFCNVGDVLLDDRDHYADRWIVKGGVFIQHDPAQHVRSVDEVYKEMDPDLAYIFKGINDRAGTKES